MDHQLDDSLNLESEMGVVEFDHGGDVVVSQDIMDGSGHGEGIPMEFEHINEQPMLMETGHEEIISPGLMGDQFTIGGDTEYVDMACSVPLDQESHGLVTTNVESQPQMTPETMMDLQFEPQTIYTSTPTTSTQQVTYSVKPRTPRPVAIAPKEVAIAPKPGPIVSKPFFTTKQYTLAPKSGPVAVGGPRATLKKVHVTGVGQKPEQTVIAQIGKQLVMLPAGSSHKIKLVQSGGISMAQLLNAKNVVGTQAVKKSVVTKVVVHNEAGASDQSAVITKLAAAGSGATGAPRFVTMQQRTVPVPISVHNKVVMGGTTNTVRFSKPKQTVVSVKSSPSKLVSIGKVAPGQKVLISNAPKNLVLKQAIPHKAMTTLSTTQVVKGDSRERPVNMTVNMAGGQRAELHEVNGVQYIRLVSNTGTSTSTKVVNATPKQGQVVALPANKTIMVTDKMGNLIQMGADKVTSGQPPPLVFTTTPGNKVSVAPKPQQRLVRIAPVMTKTSQANTSQPRPGQSLLAPITPDRPRSPRPAALSPPSEEDSKAALRQLIEDVNKEIAEQTDDRTESYTDDSTRVPQHEVEVAFERMSSPVQEEDTNNSSTSPRAGHKQQLVCKQEEHQEHPLIVIPASYVDEHHDSSYSDRRDHSVDLSTLYEERFRIGNSFMNSDINAFPQPTSPPNFDNDLDNRPRKACNCTKSQCLKLYCDCFANGEFCNRCNCNNCHNNLENEELRQKAIRGCLDRNPNAFRPKIGKSKAGGPETVRRHNKGCNCKRSGCLKNYCECYEAKIACTAICKCVGCRNVEEALERLLRRREAQERKGTDSAALFRPPPLLHVKQPCTFMTTEVIEAVCQCLIAAAAEHDPRTPQSSAVPDCEEPADPVKGVLDEFARCLQDIISAAHQGPPLHMIDEVPIL